MRPKLDPKRGIVLTIIVFARSVDDINLFIDKLEATGAFAQLQKLDERLDDQNQLQATIEGVYTPMAAHPGAEGERSRSMTLVKRILREKRAIVLPLRAGAGRQRAGVRARRLSAGAPGGRGRRPRRGRGRGLESRPNAIWRRPGRW